MAKGKKIAKSIRLGVYVRDDWTCQYCGRRFDPCTEDERSGRLAPLSYETGAPVWLELDHVIPRSLLGPDTVDNFRAACSPCNRSKSVSMAEANWHARIAAAQLVLANSEPGRAAAQGAARVLLGVNVTIDSKGRVTL